MQAHRITYLVFLVLVIGLAASFRLPDLASRPMHADEAVQAARFRKLWREHDYRYDPDEFHGPTLPYSTLPSVWLSRPGSFAASDETTYRIVPVLYGCLTVALAGWLLVDGLGGRSAMLAAFLAALSPCLVFYSRYYIHETLFVFFTLAGIVAAWRYLRSKHKLLWCLALGASLGCLQATKETSVLVLAAAFTATLYSTWMHRRRPDVSHRPGQSPARFRWWHAAVVLLTAAAVAATLLSSFFTNLRGPLDGVMTYVPWISRAASTSFHDHPWHFYLQRLILWRYEEGPWWSEGMLLLLAAVAFAAALFRPQSLPSEIDKGLVAWLGLYALTLITIYSVIPYKTPWCVTGFVQAATLLAGVGATALLQARRSRLWKAGIVLLLLAGCSHLGWQAYRASFPLSADRTNPYVYAHTTDRIQRLVDDLDRLAAVAPAGYDMRVKLIWEGNYYWPLPWYLRRFSRVEYWNRVPADAAAAIVLASPQHDQALTARLSDTHFMTGYYEIRPNVLAMLWVRDDVWVAHVDRLQRERQQSSGDGDLQPRR